MQILLIAVLKLTNVVIVPSKIMIFIMLFCNFFIDLKISSCKNNVLYCLCLQVFCVREKETVMLILIDNAISLSEILKIVLTILRETHLNLMMVLSLSNTLPLSMTVNITFDLGRYIDFVRA